MKSIITLLFITSFYVFNIIAQQLTLIDSVRQNLIYIEDARPRIQNLNLSDFAGTIGSQNPTNMVCESSTDIIVPLGDSLYNYNFVTNKYSLIGPAAPGKWWAGFDALTKDNKFRIVAAVSWDSVYYFRDSSWIYSGYYANSNSDLISVGCGKNSTFFLGGYLYYFNGSSKPKLIRKNFVYAVADLAVDERDYAWILSASKTMNWPVCDTLRIIDSLGRSVCDIPFKDPINTINGYGMLIHNGQVMVAFGGGNSSFPNSLVALKIDSLNNYVTFENPIPISPSWGADLGGCSKNTETPECHLVGVQETQFSNSAYKIYPLPFHERLNIESKDFYLEEVSVINLTGQKVLHKSKTMKILSLQTSDLPAGFYIIQITQKDHNRTNILINKYD